MHRTRRLIAYLALAATVLVCPLGRGVIPPPTAQQTAASGQWIGAPSATAPSRPTRSPVTAAAPAVPLPAVTPPARLPAVLTQVSFAVPGGDAHHLEDLVVDAEGRAIVLCHQGDGPYAGRAALVVIDPHTGTRGPIMPLPFGGATQIAIARGRVYVEYRESTGDDHDPHLAAVDPETGRLLADAPLADRQTVIGFVAGRDGRLYLPMEDGLEVRDGATLGLVRSEPNLTQKLVSDGIVIDPQGERLYLLTTEYLRAYRAADLHLLWRAPAPPVLFCQLVVDAAGRYVYYWCYPYQEQWDTGCLLAFEADSGRALDPVCFPVGPQGDGHRASLVHCGLLTADSEQGYLLFQGDDGVLWKTGLDGRPLPPCPAPAGYAEGAGACQGHVFVPSYGDHLVSIFSLADLHLEHRVILGVEILDLMIDADQGRLYVADSAGRVHTLDAHEYRRIGSVEAGTDLLALDGPNHLLFVMRWSRQDYHEVAVVDTSALTVTGVITGGDAIAIDSAGHRAFAGSTNGEAVQVWDTRTLAHLGTIAHGGAPAYNPLRDELYLPLSDGPGAVASILDGGSLTVTGELRFRVEAGSRVRVSRIALDARQGVVTARYYPEGFSGLVPEPPLFSARTLEPLTHTLTVVDIGEPVVLPTEDGHVYGQWRQIWRESRDCRAFIWRAGTDRVFAEQEHLCLDLVLPGTHVGLAQGGWQVQYSWRAFDLRTWKDLGPLVVNGLRVMDPEARRIYAWEEGSTLTVLGY